MKSWSSLKLDGFYSAFGVLVSQSNVSEAKDCPTVTTPIYRLRCDPKWWHWWCVRLYMSKKPPCSFFFTLPPPADEVWRGLGVGIWLVNRFTLYGVNCLRIHSFWQDCNETWNKWSTSSVDVPQHSFSTAGLLPARLCTIVLTLAVMVICFGINYLQWHFFI